MAHTVRHRREGLYPVRGPLLPSKNTLVFVEAFFIQGLEGALHEATASVQRHHPLLCLYSEREHVMPCAVLFEKALPM